MGIKRYYLYYQNDFGDRYSAFEVESVDGVYVTYEDHKAEIDELEKDKVDLASQLKSLIDALTWSNKMLLDITDQHIKVKKTIEENTELISEMNASSMDRIFSNAEIKLKGIKQQQAEIDELKKKYGELLFAVSIKHPDKSRHETALRYIRQAEHQQDNAPEQQEKE